MKKTLSTISLLVALTGLTQNIEFSKKLDVNIQLTGEYVGALGEHIRYEKVLDDQILRLEENRIALFNQELEKLWSLELETVKSVGGDNYYYVASDKEHIFIVQFGAAFKSSNAQSRLTCINLQGESKSILLSENIELRGINGLDIIDGNLHLIFSHTTGSATNPYTKGLEIYSSIVVLNPDLEYVGTNYDLPSHLEEDPKFNTVWSYSRTDGENIVLKSYYFLTPNGKYYTYSKDGAEQYEMILIVDKDNNLVSNKSHKLATKDQVPYTLVYNNPIKFDPNVYKVKAGIYKFTKLRVDKADLKLYITKDSVNSGNIIAQFFDLTKLNTGAVRTFNGSSAKVVDVVEDPLNENVNIILISETGTRYLLTLNSELKLAYVQEYKTCYKPHNFSSIGSNFTNGFSDVSASWGTIPNDHIPNAFDLAMKQTEKSQFTVVNYPTYQLLFTDNKSSNEVHVYKVVR